MALGFNGRKLTLFSREDLSRWKNFCGDTVMLATMALLMLRIAQEGNGPKLQMKRQLSCIMGDG